MEPLLLRLVAHVSAYRVILARCPETWAFVLKPCTRGHLRMQAQSVSLAAQAGVCWMLQHACAHTLCVNMHACMAWDSLSTYIILGFLGPRP